MAKEVDNLTKIDANGFIDILNTVKVKLNQFKEEGKKLEEVIVLIEEEINTLKKWL